MSEDLMFSTIEEQVFWCNCVRGLPKLEGFSGTGIDKFGELIPYGTGPHSLRAFREAFEIVNPKLILEIGMNMGYATVVFLELSKEAKIITCDISLKEETIEAAKILKDKYSHRFHYFHRDSELFSLCLSFNHYDIAFIDGGHLKHDVLTDISLCLNHKIPYLLFDDVLPQFGDVQECIDNFSQLELIKTWGNIALYKNKDL